MLDSSLSASPTSVIRRPVDHSKTKARLTLANPAHARPMPPSISSSRMPQQRWQIATAQSQQAQQLSEAVQLHPLLAQVLLNRGIDLPENAQEFLQPESQVLPSPASAFPDLTTAVQVLMDAIAHRDKIAICGDYDADGMTSTALLLRSLRWLGADADYAIPSRMHEGYGINTRIVEEFHDNGVKVILTVDNGIAAPVPIARARELGLQVIVTDHHDIPPQLPPANAILNPKLIPEDSPYRGLAGVGVAYILAISLAQCLQQLRNITNPLLELFTLGTIADLAPLTGVNRRWVRRGLKLLPSSQLAGVQALIQVAGLGGENKALKPEAIGFRLGPRINAVGRIAEPSMVIELLTTDDPGRALELAMGCEQINERRQLLCELIERDAIAWCEDHREQIIQDRVLVVVQPEWHHGVIGIVASRLVERYGVPVFIGTYEKNDPSRVRGSARGIAEFHVFEALQFCDVLLDKYGGHRAAGGFSLNTANLEDFKLRLSIFAHNQLLPEHLKPLVKIDAQAELADLTLDLYEQIDHLHPCGMDNPDPVFWTPDVRIVEQRTIGKEQAHLKLTILDQHTHRPVVEGQVSAESMKAIAWRWGEFCPLPSPVDLAYRLRLNEWNGKKSVELEIVGIRPSSQSEPATVTPHPSTTATTMPHASTHQDLSSDDLRSNLDGAIASMSPQRVEFNYCRRKYSCSLSLTDSARELRIRNPEGYVLAVQPNQHSGLLGKSRDDAKSVDISHPFYLNLIRAAIQALETADSHIPDRSPQIPESGSSSATPTPPDSRASKPKSSRSTAASVRLPDLPDATGSELGTESLLPNSQASRELRTDSIVAEAIAKTPSFDLSKTIVGEEPNEARSPMTQTSQPHYRAISSPWEDDVTAPEDSVTDTVATPEMDTTSTPDLSDDPSDDQLATDTESTVIPDFPLMPDNQVWQDESEIADRNAEAEGSENPYLDAFLQQLRKQPVAFSAKALRQQLQAELGGDRWDELSSRSQTDLAAAYRTYQQCRLEASDDEVDVAPAIARLLSVVEREVSAPFFKALYQFMKLQDAPNEIGGIQLKSRKKYDLSLLPALLADQWQAFVDPTIDPMQAESVDDELEIMETDQLSESDRQFVADCLADWDSSVAEWLSEGEPAASAIAQCAQFNEQLNNDEPMSDWQFIWLHHLLLGDDYPLLK